VYNSNTEYEIRVLGKDVTYWADGCLVFQHRWISGTDPVFPLRAYVAIYGSGGAIPAASMTIAN
jgi:hypothetical protein